MKKLDEYLPELERCVRCGVCKGGCPSFAAEGREWASARGRVALLEALIRGSLEMTDTFVKRMKDCTLCGACACPNGIDIPGLILAARAAHVEKEGLSIAASMVFKRVLDSKRLGPVAMKAAAKLQGLVLKPEASGASSTDAMLRSGLVSKLQIPYLPIEGKGRLVPRLAKKFFLERPEVRALGESAPGGDSRTVGLKVALFAGCAVNYLMPELGRSALRSLKASGAEVTVPRAQLCCGMPALSTGDTETARSLALKNLEAFEASGADHITTACATCTHALKENFISLLCDEGPEMRRRVEAFSSKVSDITELLERELTVKARPAEERKVVTYHDPCHLARGMGVKDEPRELIVKSGHSFSEMKNPCKCCGLGGGLSFSNYELSMEIMRSKAENIKESKADIVATACPGCMIQIRDGLRRFGVDAEVKHVIELL